MRVLVPLPDRDFDTTEVAVPWRALRSRGIEVEFATQRGGAAPECDPRLITGVIFGRLGADPDAIAAYREMEQDDRFNDPIAWDAIGVSDFDGLLLAGGHAPGMRQYLGDEVLQRKVAAFWALGRPVAAICHGVLVLARSLDPQTGRSVLAGHRTTCLPKRMERAAYFATAWRLGRYYRTYPAYVEDEVVASLETSGGFDAGPLALKRGTAEDDSPAFVVEDGRYVSGRWPGDAHLLAKRFISILDRDRGGNPVKPAA